ncbi:hypothetical protein Tco_0090649 [Tanacetum coccineum]
MRAEYNILEKRKWRTLAEEKNTLLDAKDMEIEDLKVDVASAKDRNTLLEQECDSLKLKVTGLESAIVEKDHKLSELGASSSSLKSQNQSLVDQVHELEVSSADLREKLEMYEELLKTFHAAPPNDISGGEDGTISWEKLLVDKCLNSMNTWRLLVICLTDLELIIPLAEDDLNSANRELRDLNIPLLQELSTTRSHTLEIMDLPHLG